MTTYSTWEYYTGEYGGQLPQAEYQRRAPSAAAEINRLTLWQAPSAPDSMAEALSQCECEFVDILASTETSGAAPGVTSVTNDGFAIQFDGKGYVSVNAALKDRAGRWLGGPVNLLFSGAVVKNVCDI